MNEAHERELWQIRFERVWELEEESFDFYNRLLSEKSALLEQADLTSLLKQILRDEARHLRIARELLAIVEKAEPDQRK